MTTTPTRTPTPNEEIVIHPSVDTRLHPQPQDSPNTLSKPHLEQPHYSTSPTQVLGQNQPSADSADSTSQLSLENAQDQLEQLIQSLETDKLKLKDALALYQQGLTLSHTCEQQLKKTDQQLESIQAQYKTTPAIVEEDFCLESSQEKLAQWLKQLESQPKLNLDEALSLYQKAMNLSAKCEAALQKAELSIQKLNEQGQIVAAPELAPDPKKNSDL